jgi:hypothetical protein
MSVCILVADKFGASKALADLGATNQRGLPDCGAYIVTSLSPLELERFSKTFAPQQKHFVAGEFSGDDAKVALALLQEAGFKAAIFPPHSIPADSYVAYLNRRWAVRWSNM